MNKIIVIGCPGSGKSTFSCKLAERTGISLYHMDMLFWNSDKTHVTREELRARLSRVMEGEAWIIDGNYLSTMEMRAEKCDTVIFLDYPTEVCLAGVEARRGKPRPDMPWVETEEDGEFTALIRGFKEEMRPKVIALLEKYGEKEIHRFTSRAEAEEFLSKI